MLIQEYENKCSCGQPYTMEYEGEYPFAERFYSKCPNCNSEISRKASVLLINFKFDKEWKDNK
ncbi:hypothetical protein AS142_16260 [Bacillus pumilus]|nr:hypothetical protein AS142_16260 [Bacillus pumilus]